ncbi:MAG: adenylyl-sulfate kinase [Candidatus Melainabacteria bacterium]|nr:MAG: adenylyl-sulfate kinase [Candidatus Melainabacteria bacterium]
MLCKNSANQDICDIPQQEVYDKPAFTVVVVGSVDHGKSTLLGRLLMESGAVEVDRVRRVETICAAKGSNFEPAFLLDALEEEQSQGVSIESTHCQLRYEGQKFQFIDAPGHLEFIKNMTGAASYARIAILVIDAVEGVRSQTIRHLEVLAMLGVTRLLVAVNKVDKINYDSAAYHDICAKTQELLNTLKLDCDHFLPISALNGENLFKASENLPWYSGKTLIQVLSELAPPAARGCNSGYFRMMLQDVYRFGGERFFAGRVVSGSITPGQLILFSPSGKVSIVEAIISYPDEKRELAVAGECVALKLSEQIFVERGEIVSRPDQAPEVLDEFIATIVWLAEEELELGAQYILKIGTAEVGCSVYAFTSNNESVDLLNRGDVRDVIIKPSSPIALDRIEGTSGLNRFVLCTKYDTVAAGSVMEEKRIFRGMPVASPFVQRENGYLERMVIEAAQGHKAAVLWLTGLSGSGKSALAKALEARLFAAGRTVMVLDGDNLRKGLCADLGFSREDRAENIRRIAEVARLLLDAGTLVIVACLSPYAEDRDRARSIIGEDDYLEIFLSCPLEVCQGRDPKGLYKKAASGEITSFSGLDSPYQPPVHPNLLIDSNQMSLDQEVEAVIALLRSKQVIGTAIGRIWPAKRPNTSQSMAREVI